MGNYYGILSSFVFSLPYVFLGIWSGIMSGKVNRKIMLGVACILWSATSIGAGAVNSFGFFVLMRFMLGGIESACNPASYSLIADYFPPAYRSTANAIETSGSYVGGGLCGIAVIVIKQYGWRTMYKIMGVTGVLMGILTILVIKEPERGRYDLMAAKTLEYSSDEDEEDIDPIDKRTKKKEKAMSAGEEFMESLTDVWKNPVAKWNTIAGMFRFFETFSIVYYLPSFMQ